MSNKVSTLALVVALVALGVAVLRPAGQAGDTSPKKETAFERILRTNTIRCGYAIWMPELVKDPTTGALSGQDYDVMNAVGKILGLKVEWTEETGWGVAEQGLVSGRYDMFCNGVWPSPPRTRAILYSRPFIYTPAYGAIAASRQVEQGVAWVNQPSTTIAVLPGTFLDTLAGFKFPQAKRFELSEMSNDGDMLLAVATGKADFGISTYASIKKYMESNPGQIQPTDQPVVYAAGGFLLPPDEFRLKHMIDFTITYLLETGAIRDILTRDLADKEHDWRYPAAEHEP